MTRCGTHGDDTTSGRCEVCDRLIHMALVQHPVAGVELVPNSTSLVPTVIVGARACWADLLEVLPTLNDGNTARLKVDTWGLPGGPADPVRVWLSRCSIEDGEPFARTVYVEKIVGGAWCPVGYFDGDEPSPRPAPPLGEGWTFTLRRLGADIREAA